MSRATHLPLRVGSRTTVALDVVEFELYPVEGGALPRWRPGAHVDVVTGAGAVRQYSLCGDPADRGRYRIAVLREHDGRGGSAWLHEQLHQGDLITVGGPRNHFRLEPGPSYVFLAGGIGITPLLTMIRQVDAYGASWSLHYGGRTRGSMAYAEDLQAIDARRVHLIPFDERGLIDLALALDSVGPETHVYCCGPESLIRAAEDACARRGLRLRTERFSPKALAPSTADTPFAVRIASTGAEVVVPAGRSIADVLGEAGVDVLTSCAEGTCGTCETAVLDGCPDHRDSVLTEEEQAAGDRILPCVSRSRTRCLVLDL
ncbi:PDR/VanB family oxidoreductase [Amycolatopsis jiangsuensis]|uniref:Ferredoxin-NADP reductase n=1 Tax=Amycolatopsis jiangsuensis TaxID=1181879 RepID=A0A840IRG5_9PSEU|nr:PDR/VanB family oxidoreductase [Amycolatopsis jiangsuensis]MBB4683822.1 ferredoxin-NADP reductase [Amycolatopsis jiangsuensis]